MDTQTFDQADFLRTIQEAAMQNQQHIAKSLKRLDDTISELDKRINRLPSDISKEVVSQVVKEIRDVTNNAGTTIKDQVTNSFAAANCRAVKAYTALKDVADKTTWHTYGIATLCATAASIVVQGFLRWFFK